jgi:hypothetical protein
MDNWKEWVLDASGDPENPPYAFSPYERETDNIVWGMVYLGEKPPYGKVVCVIHKDGQVATEKWCEKHKEELEKLKE